MRKLAMTATLAMLTIGPSALAQTGSGTLSSGKYSPSPLPAPTGHRQPRLDQVPADTSNSANDAMKREDAELDRKLKSICRGC